MTENKLKIIIVDDNIELTSILTEYLNNQSDIDVIAIAKDGIEACEMISSKQPDIVILDIIMPGLDGISVIENMNKLSLSKKPVYIILSAVSQDKTIKKALALGAEYYFIKPFDMEILISRIRKSKRIPIHQSTCTKPVQVDT